MNATMEELILNEITQAVKDLTSVHLEDIEEFGQEAEDRKSKFSFAVEISWGDPNKVKTKLSFGKRVKDEREQSIEDPNQTKLPFGGGAN